MEPFDKEKAARVWRRVNEAAPEAALEGLSALAAGEAELGVLCKGFAPEITRQCSAHIAMLRGICHLSGLSRPAAGAGKANPRPLEAACGKCMALLRGYESRFAHPEYGPVFQTMARSKQEQLCKLLTLLGSRK